MSLEEMMQSDPGKVVCTKDQTLMQGPSEEQPGGVILSPPPTTNLTSLKFVLSNI